MAERETLATSRPSRDVSLALRPRCAPSAHSSTSVLVLDSVSISSSVLCRGGWIIRGMRWMVTHATAPSQRGKKKDGQDFCPPAALLSTQPAVRKLLTEARVGRRSVRLGETDCPGCPSLCSHRWARAGQPWRLSWLGDDGQNGTDQTARHCHHGTALGRKETAGQPRPRAGTAWHGFNRHDMGPERQ